MPTRRARLDREPLSLQSIRVHRALAVVLGALTGCGGLGPEELEPGFGQEASPLAQKGDPSPSEDPCPLCRLEYVDESTSVGVLRIAPHLASSVRIVLVGEDKFGDELFITETWIAKIVPTLPLTEVEFIAKVPAAIFPGSDKHPQVERFLAHVFDSGSFAGPPISIVPLTSAGPYYP